MRVVIYVILAILAVVILYGLFKLLVWFTTRDLRAREDAYKREIIDLRQEIADLRASEPEKMQLLRTEICAYDKLIDDIQDELVTPKPLELASTQERVSNLIRVHRPERTF